MSAPIKLLVIGIDGLNNELIQRLLPVEVMPTLNERIRTSCSGSLLSVYPTHSASAWASFMTGQSPAGHGVFDFKMRLPNGRYRHAKPNPDHTIWKILGKYGYRVGVYNFPVSYPPDSVNGWMITGMLSPDLERSTYPHELALDVRTNYPDYTIDVEWTLYDGRPEDLLNDLTTAVHQRIEVANYLLSREPIDCFFMAFTATDRAQHAIWRYLNPSHPLYSQRETEKLQPLIHNFYRTLDKGVKQLTNLTSEESITVLLSDHGFQSAAWQFHVNRWLEKMGWLSYYKGAGLINRIVRQLDSPAVKQFRRKLFIDISRHFDVLSPGGSIDWAKTSAFSPWNYHQGIRINTRGRDPNGIISSGQDYEKIRSEIAEALMNIRHPESNSKVVNCVHLREDLYNGLHADKMPDLIFDLNPNFAQGLHRTNLFEQTGWVSGDHSLDGFISISGPGVKYSSLEYAKLIDVAPSILHWLGIPIPEWMHGALLTEINTSAFPDRQGREISRAAFGDGKTHRSDEIEPDDEEHLLDQLRKLGYL